MIRCNAYAADLCLKSITPLGPTPDILPKDEEVRAAAAASRSTNQ